MAELSIEGFAELQAKIQALGDKASKAENRSLRAGAEVIQKVASLRAPRGNAQKDHLADNIVISGIKTSQGVKVIQIGPGKGFFYGMFPEWGTSKMPAKPYLGPAAAESRADVLAAMRDAVRGDLK